MLRNKDLRSRRRTAVLINMFILLAATTNLQALADGRARAISEVISSAALVKAETAGLVG